MSSKDCDYIKGLTDLTKRLSFIVLKGRERCGVGVVLVLGAVKDTKKLFTTFFQSGPRLYVVACEYLRSNMYQRYHTTSVFSRGP